MPVAVLAASNFTDPEHERLIWLAAGGLVLLGVLLLVVTVVWWRGTKGEHAALATLEVMGDRSFPTLTPVEQDRRLDAVRLHLEGDVEPVGRSAPEPVDLDEALRSFEPGFDDLRDADAPAAEAADAEQPPADPPRIAVEVIGAGPAAGVDPEAAADEPTSEEIDTAEVDAAEPDPATPSDESESEPEAAVEADDAPAKDDELDDDALRTGEPVDR